MPHYDCSKCPAYCCSYDEISVTDRDVNRLARHFDLEPDVAAGHDIGKTPAGKTA